MIRRLAFPWPQRLESKEWSENRRRGPFELPPLAFTEMDKCLFLFPDDLNDEAPHAGLIVEIEKHHLLPRPQTEAPVYHGDLE